MSSTLAEIRTSPDEKELGAYYTPHPIVRSLVEWGLGGDVSRFVLDPSCGDGRFLHGLRNAVGVEIDEVAVRAAKSLSNSPTIVEEDFFEWASTTNLRFDAAIGNPPFIRYQRFRGVTRAAALALCKKAGLELTALTSSWAPFIVGASMLLRTSGRIAFVVPAEIAHAVYARPVVKWLLESFGRVEVVAFRQKLFSNLSEDCWLLRASGFGGTARVLHLACLESFAGNSKWEFEAIDRRDLQESKFRIRPFLLPTEVRETYRRVAASDSVYRLGSVAKLGIGYVTGANDFFHLRPSQARQLRIPSRFFRVAVRSNRDLSDVDVLDESIVKQWIREDRPVLLLDLGAVNKLPRSVQTYLDSKAGRAARRTYKCRSRNPWYAVPDVRVPSAFLSIMSGGTPRLVPNEARAVCTNSVHAVHFLPEFRPREVSSDWKTALTQLSCEVEGHALGGGLLKLEPREAREVLLADPDGLTERDRLQLELGVRHMKRWRYAFNAA